MICSMITKRRAEQADLRPGLVVHSEDCGISLLVLSGMALPGGEEFDWASGIRLDVYPTIVYLRVNGKIMTKAGCFPVLSSAYHIAEIQKLEEPA